MTETRCVFVASDAPRMLAGRHESDCEDDDCRGCQPCTEAHCRLDGRTHLDVTHPHVCPECVGGVRDDMTEIRDLCVHLRERAYTGADGQGRRFASMQLPGGDPLALISPVGDGSADQKLRWAPVYDPEHPAADENGYRDASDDDSGHLATLERPGDPEAPLGPLAQWEDVWRAWLGLDAGPRATIGGALKFLSDHLTRMAQELDRETPHGPEFAPDFEEFARDMRRLRRHVENALVDGERAEVTRVPCLTCGARLVKVYGRWESDDHHACPRCRRNYPADGRDFARAKQLAKSGDASETWILLADAAKSIGRSPHTVRTWVNAGKVRTDRELIEHETGNMVRVYVWWPDVRHADTESGRRSRSA